MAPTEKPILFHYPGSIYSYRILWYLWLRGIEYDECIQSPVMPRPDLASIDVAYRRMPLMAIGKDMYIDSRLILSKLESLYPNSVLSPPTAADIGIKKLFESYNVDGGIFTNAVKLMPYWDASGSLQNKAFLDDRQKLSGGRRMTAEAMERGRPEALQHMCQVFELMETTFLADGRKWILGSEGPTVADIDAVWPLEWLVMERAMKGSLPETHFSEKIYPRTYAWVRRFMSEVVGKKQQTQPPTRLDGAQMKTRILGATSPLEATSFAASDPLDLQPGDEVEVFPSDYGQAHKDKGTIIGLTTTEVVIRNIQNLHLHFPRWNFRIAKAPLAAPSIRPAPRQKMRLIYHPMSPYSRKVAILAHELNLTTHLTLEKVVVCPVAIPGWSDDNSTVSAFNPLTKIPCLVPADVPDGLFDSRVICDYLCAAAGVRARPADTRYWQLRALHACADGIMDAAVLISYEVRIRQARGLYFEEWVGGQKAKMERALDRFEAAAGAGLLPVLGAGPPSVDEVAVVVATVLTRSVGIRWEEGRPRLAAWIAPWAARRSFLMTPPTRDWVVEGGEKGASKI